jgi:hypothetical protein
MTALTLALIMSGHSAQGMSSREVIMNCLKKYVSTNSGTGEFVMNQSAGGKKLSIKTEFQFARPNKLYLHQSSESVAPNDWLVVSDGVNFGYDAPVRTDARRRLFEPTAVTATATGEKRILKLQSIYLAAKRSLGDAPNPFLEFITQSTDDDQSLKGYLTRLYHKVDAQPKEKELVDGSTGYSINGIMGTGDALAGQDNKGNGQFESYARYEMQISKEFELVSMKTIESISITDKTNNLPTTINIVTTWTGKLNTSTNPVEALFKVR